MTSNEYYGGLNDRFEGRSARLRKLGFVYKRIEEYDVGVFTMRRFGKVKSIQTSAVMHADERSWADIVESAEQFVA